MSISEAIKNIEQSVANTKMQAAQTKALSDAMMEGDNWRQGDIYITMAKQVPAKAKRIFNTQLAEGNTQGSRHILSDPSAVEVYEVSMEDILKENFTDSRCEKVAKVFSKLPSVVHGPMFKVVKDVELSHPEHGNRILKAGTCYIVTYQLDLGAETLRRIAD